jgi:uncharacterized protein (TIGR03435 family)
VGKRGPKLKESKGDEPDVIMRSNYGLMTGVKATMPMFASSLSHRVERQVVDETGLKGAYNFKLEFTPDQKGSEPDEHHAPPPGDHPSIFTALQEQLGLNLKAGKGPVQVLVIDRAEKPTDNSTPPVTKQGDALHLPAAALDGSIRSHAAAGQAPPAPRPYVAGPVAQSNTIDPKSYVIGVEDILKITVWREPDLSGAVGVRPDGRITLALIGEVQAAGLTPARLTAMLQEAYSGKIRDPHVMVEVLQVNSKHGGQAPFVAANAQSKPAPAAAQAIQAQPRGGPALSFEVASIKPAPAGTRGYTWSRRIEAGRLDTTTTVQGLLMWAYDLKVDSQVAGGPVWLDSDKYVVAAKAAGPVSMKQLQQMTRTLLAERFKLTIHRETKEQTVLALVVANKGPKLSRSKFESDDDFSVTIGTGKIIAQRARMDDLANQLTGNQNRIVVDRTGLTGAYDFKLEFTPERPDGSPVPGSDPAGPTILVALQEQLGLKLESIKAPVEVMVIDHAEKPTEN